MAFQANLPSGKWHGTIRLTINAPWFDTDEQMANYHASVKSSGNLIATYPNLATHGRVNIDGTACMYESSWTEEECSRAYWIPRLALATGKNETAIDAQLELEVVGEGLSIEDGNVIVKQYLYDNAADWGEVVA